MPTLPSAAVRLGEFAARSSARAALREVVGPAGPCCVDDVRGGATGGSFLRRPVADLSYSVVVPATGTGEANAVRDVIGDDWAWSGWVGAGLAALALFPLGRLDGRLEDAGEAFALSRLA